MGKRTDGKMSQSGGGKDGGGETIFKKNENRKEKW